MGLDMYLRGEVHTFSKRVKRHGFERESETVRLGYWRKHPNLHGYIVQTFADGRDNCQRIDLTSEDLEKIISAVNQRELPVTTGFFFGTSDGSEYEEDLAILTRALEWLTKDVPEQCRYVYYQASW